MSFYDNNSISNGMADAASFRQRIDALQQLNPHIQNDDIRIIPELNAYREGDTTSFGLPLNQLSDPSLLLMLLHEHAHGSDVQKNSFNFINDPNYNSTSSSAETFAPYGVMQAEKEADKNALAWLLQNNPYSSQQWANALDEMHGPNSLLHKPAIETNILPKGLHPNDIDRYRFFSQLVR